VVLVEKKDSHELYAMKVLKKQFLIESKNVEYTRTEREILRTVRHPFLCSLHYAFQTSGKLYLVMDFLSGGQLLFHLRREAMLSEVHVRFYAAEVDDTLSHQSN
jgi:serine/threonine protein kinase